MDITLKIHGKAWACDWCLETLGDVINTGKHRLFVFGNPISQEQEKEVVELYRDKINAPFDKHL